MHRSRHCIDNILIHFTVSYLINSWYPHQASPCLGGKQRQTTTEQKKHDPHGRTLHHCLCRLPYQVSLRTLDLSRIFVQHLDETLRSLQRSKCGYKCLNGNDHRAPEDPKLSASRVHSYMPDNLYARLSTTPISTQPSTQARQTTMRAQLDRLSSSFYERK